MGTRPGKKAMRWYTAATTAVAVGVLAITTMSSSSAASLSVASKPKPGNGAAHGHDAQTATPIKHVVVLYDENVSFDHYFGTYPNAANTDGTVFKAAKHTPAVDGLTKTLLEKNPNLYNPKRLAPEHALTCDQSHSYGSEQLAFNGGKMDQFVQKTGKDTCTGQPILFGEPGLVMDYYDGNTVTGLWNYAQNYAMSDNSYGTGFGPSTPGAINLVSGQTHGVYGVDSVTHEKIIGSSVSAAQDANGVGTVTSDPDPAFDDCSDGNHTSKNNLAVATGLNIGDLLNKKDITWGWFQGGFRPTGTANGYSVCGSSTPDIAGYPVPDYSPHHSAFQYYQSTSNPKHLPPSSVAAIGHTDQANHNYDLTDFDAALTAGNLPSVSFLKAPSAQDGHPGSSDPLDEQLFLVNTINKIQKSKDWDSTAIIIAYDDSDGWYDHKMGPIVNGSSDPAHDSAELCGTAPASGGYADRCGYGPRLPLLVVSPYSKVNYVDHQVTDQSSIIKFIEDNWRTDRIGDSSADAKAGDLSGMFDFKHAKAKSVTLNPTTGAVVSISKH